MWNIMNKEYPNIREPEILSRNLSVLLWGIKGDIIMLWEEGYCGGQCFVGILYIQNPIINTIINQVTKLYFNFLATLCVLRGYLWPCA